MQNDLYHYSFERAVLSSMVFSPEDAGEILGLGLEQEDFYLPFHQKLYVMLQKLYDKSTIEESLIKHHMGSDFDEEAFLEILATSPVTKVEVYVQKLQEYRKLREFKQIAHKILHSIDREEGASETLHLVHEELEKIEEGGKDLFEIKRLGQIEAREGEFIGKSWLPFPKYAVSLVTAGGGVGKSFLILQAAMRMVQDEKLKVFMWLSEDPLSLSRYRAEMISMQILERDIGDYGGMLHLAGADSETIHFLEESRGGVYTSSKFYQFKAMLKEYDVIILDPLIAMFGADENNNAHARKFINLFTRWATKEKKTIIFIHHGTKNSSQSRGASAFVDAVRLVYRVEHIKNNEAEMTEEESRYIILDKDNNGAKKFLGATRVKRQVFPKKKTVIEIEYV